MPNVLFTQYLRPNGRRTHVMIDRPDYIAKAADFIRAQGFRFEMEELSDGVTVSMTISDDDGDYHFKVCQNGPGIPASVDELIKTFDMAKAKKQREQNA